VAQTLLGHSDLEETTLYLHLSQRRLNATASPLDALKLKDESPQDQ
jgi:site-specific recombinase XerD